MIKSGSIMTGRQLRDWATRSTFCDRRKPQQEDIDKRLIAALIFWKYAELKDERHYVVYIDYDESGAARFPRIRRARGGMVDTLA